MIQNNIHFFQGYGGSCFDLSLHNSKFQVYLIINDYDLCFLFQGYGGLFYYELMENALEIFQCRRELMCKQG